MKSSQDLALSVTRSEATLTNRALSDSEKPVSGRTLCGDCWLHEKPLRERAETPLSVWSL